MYKMLLRMMFLRNEGSWASEKKLIYDFFVIEVLIVFLGCFRVVMVF